jgi:hypothetical protein
MAQRVVTLLAVAVALYLVGIYITTDGHPVRSGWFAYGPNTDPILPEYDIMGSGASLAVWLGLLGGWLGFALWLLASNRPTQSAESS